jgi:hypothetical protein
MPGLIGIKPKLAARWNVFFEGRFETKIQQAKNCTAAQTKRATPHASRPAESNP